MIERSLATLVRDAAREHPHRVAVVAADGVMTYRELDAAADRAAAGLRQLGVRPGDRVALWGEKSTRVVAAMQGVLRLGAAYVPIDPGSPPHRACLIARDCTVSAVVVDPLRASDLRAGLDGSTPMLLTQGAAEGERCLTWADLEGLHDAEPAERHGDDLAYILYTSGSTGMPKGVCLSHRNALAFIEWAAVAIGVGPNDRLSSHAPFHFDLSVFDLYAAFRAGASVFLIPRADADAPARLVHLIEQHRISVWYSVPSVLMLLVERAGLGERAPTSLRAVIFAGEVYPVSQLAKLRAALPAARLFNWYGPTETNVCTAHEVGPEDALDTAIPIGRAVCGDHAWARRPDGSPASVGEQGELIVEGPTVMLGYWGHPPQAARPYATGDNVTVLPGQAFRYVGRRDHMLKIRGHRIEPGEIEARLQSHPAVTDAVVLARGAGSAARLVAAIVAPEPPSLIAIKVFLASELPRHMLVDELVVLDSLPRTSNGKVDRRRLLDELG
jgi:amino acid adenylation domain-containing protein